MAVIAIVDDEQSIRESLRYALEKEGHEVETYGNGEEAWEGFCSSEPDLMILDIMMPRMDGLELCRRIRTKSEQTALMFLSSRDEEFDKVLGLEIGGDDYLCKPFSVRELTARVKVLLRRSARAAAPAPSAPGAGGSPGGEIITAGALQLCEERYQAWWGGEPLVLTITEFRILLDLGAAPGTVRTREQLITAAFPLDNYVSDRSVDSHIKRLRKKFTALDAAFDRIETVYGLGYRFREGVMRSLTVRLLIFNLLLVIFPVAGMLYLDTYEQQLLELLERSMVQQGRVLAASLSGEELQDESVRIITNMKGRLDARIRVVDASGRLLADSSDPRLTPPAVSETYKFIRSTAQDIYAETPDSVRENWLYRAAVYPINILRRMFLPPSPPLGSAEYYSGAAVLDGPEVQAALQGRYGAYTRYSTGGQRSITLYSAIPVTDNGGVTGAVLVSRSTYRILTDLYNLRLDMLRVFLLSVTAAAVLSLILARTITIPVKKLRDQAETFLDHRGRLRGEFKQLKNKDEIGDLSRSLNTLSRRLDEHISFISGFSADISHEMKNPVAGIRVAAELAEGEGTEEQARFFRIIQRETGRIQRLLDDLRDVSQIDVKIDTEERLPVDPAALLEEIVRTRSLRPGAPSLVLEAAGGDEAGAVILASKDRLSQCVINLLDNAESFTPPGGRVLLRLTRKEGSAVIEVLDEGPGIPGGSPERIFERFYTDRPGEERKDHSGLGLSIVRSIAEGYGGSVTAGNRASGGARFTLTFPTAQGS